MIERLGIGRLAIFFTAVWLILNAGGHFSIAGFPKFYSSNCFGLIGCNRDFSGPDAYVHFLSGVAAVFIVVWFMSRYSDILHHPTGRTVLVAILVSAAMSVVWELFEFGADWFRIEILDMDLWGMDRIAQPSLIDTIGDFVYALVGSAISSLAILRRW
jgi:hypothetical protein